MVAQGQILIGHRGFPFRGTPVVFSQSNAVNLAREVDFKVDFWNLSYRFGESFVKTYR